MITIVIVVVVIGAIIVAALAIDWDLSPPEEPKEPRSIDMDTPTVTQRTIGDGTFWDSTASVTVIDPPDAEVIWESVRVVVKDANTSVLMGKTSPEPNNPPMYDNGSDGKVDVQVWYIDIDGDGHMETGDRLKFTERYEGAKVEIYYGQRQIGTFTLPEEFP
jgi:hypothetical protein